MLSYRFIVKGSKGTPYIATFDFSENFGKAKCSCTCRGGIEGSFCKHRTALMNGDFTALRSDNKVDYSNFQRLVINTDLGLALARMLLAKASVAEATEEERLATSALKKFVVC